MTAVNFDLFSHEKIAKNPPFPTQLDAAVGVKKMSAGKARGVATTASSLRQPPAPPQTAAGGGLVEWRAPPGSNTTAPIGGSFVCEECGETRARGVAGPHALVTGLGPEHDLRLCLACWRLNTGQTG